MEQVTARQLRRAHGQLVEAAHALQAGGTAEEQVAYAEIRLAIQHAWAAIAAVHAQPERK